MIFIVRLYLISILGTEVIYTEGIHGRVLIDMFNQSRVSIDTQPQVPLVSMIFQINPT